jgi:hypothetical protein
MGEFLVTGLWKSWISKLIVFSIHHFVSGMVDKENHINSRSPLPRLSKTSSFYQFSHDMTVKLACFSLLQSSDRLCLGPHRNKMSLWPLYCPCLSSYHPSPSMISVSLAFVGCVYPSCGHINADRFSQSRACTRGRLSRMHIIGL